ncbi:MAG TPA: solute:sodium symporter family transporter [Kiritimatiellia bacterium]|nr:solute:sodium symporter family transporter [Kiritimatiellia bacterium]
MDLTALLTFVGFTALVAVIAGRVTRGTNLDKSGGFFLAGRSLPWFVIAGSMVLTNISTEQLIGLNGNAFMHGASVMAWETIAAVAMVAMALFFLPRYLKSGITTLPQFLEQRFGRLMRSMISLVFLTALTLSFLPFVLYSGAIGMNSLFHVDVALGISPQASLWLMVIALSIAGLCYVVFGGMKAEATADSINGIGLVLGGLLIPVLGLVKLGDGSLGTGFRSLTESRPELLSPIGGPESSVPFSTLFTGMLIINLFYWCTNQVIIQRALGGKSLAESQKGVLFAAVLKIIGICILVLPGIVAWHLLAAGKLDVAHQDLAYPRLVAAVLPGWLTGFFGAVMFGAILSSFNSGLTSVTTLFGMDIYKQLVRPAATDHQVVRAGRLFGLAIVCICIAIAPMIAQAPEGLYTFMRKMMAFFNIPILSIILLGVLSRRAPAFAAYIAVPVGIVFYGWVGFVHDGAVWGLKIHWLHVAGLNLVLMLSIMAVVRILNPLPHPVVHHISDEVDITPWRHARLAGAGVIVLVVALYLVLSQLA